MRFHSIIAVFFISFVQANFPVTAQTKDEGDDFYGRKYALVIGNSKYESSPLKNPENDATDIAATLTKIGFKVTTVLNADIATFRLALAQFESSLPEGAAVMVFYAGHGVQYQGQNFLVPIGSISKILKADDLFTNAITLNEMLEQLSSRRKSISVVILDACRNSPFTSLPDVTSGLSRNVAGKRGLGRVDTAKKKKGGSLEGVVIAYSTAPDMTAADGDGRNSPYAKHLKEFLRRPNTTLETVLKLTRLEVTKETGGQQTPWYETSINGEFYVAGRGRIEFEDLLRLVIPKVEPGGISWEFNSDLPHPLVVREVPVQTEVSTLTVNKDPELYFSNQTFSFFIKLEYQAVILMDGAETHTQIRNGRGSGVFWNINFFGPRPGYVMVELNASTMGFGGPDKKHGFGASKLLKEDTTCARPDGGLNGTRVFAINLKGYEPAWLAESYTCGASNCQSDYILFLSKDDKQKFGCR
ncbi:MAG: caspase family protein [Chitinophagales bacterium]|nr:caspase family protein [Hyphomicrobiales bacterium]